MKPLLVFLTVFIATLIISCDSTEPTVGSNEDTVIPNLFFTVDTTYLDTANNRLVAKGTVKNNGSSQVTSPWYVEAQFYTNASRSTKLGGNYTEIGVPLSTGQSTFWTINYSSQNVDVRDYPNFTVGDLRGIYK